MIRTIITFALLGGLICLFVLSWVLNHKTKIPESCRVNKKECVGCSFKGCPSFIAPEAENEEIVKSIDIDKEVQEEINKNLK